MPESHARFSLGLRLLRREWRGGELAVLASAVVIAVAAVTAVSFFTDRVGQAMELRAGEVLAADLVLRSDRPLPAEYRERAEQDGLRTGQTTRLSTVVASGDATRLIDLRGVSPSYPLRGRMRVADAPFEAARETHTTPAPGTVWADARLLATLDLAVGDRLQVGETEFTISKVLANLPDQGVGFGDIAPAVVMGRDDLPLTGLITEGSRVTHRLLLAGEPRVLGNWRDWAEDRLEDGQRLQNASESRQEISAALDRAGRFLALAALVSVVVAGVAVALAAREWAGRRLDAAALMKTFGASQGRITRLYAAQLLGLGLVCGLLGLALGRIAQGGLVATLGGLLGEDLPAATWMAPAVTGLAVATVLLVGFALPPLLALRRTPPARVLRRELGPAPPRAWLVHGLAIVAVSALVLWQLGDTGLGLGVLAGGGLTLLALLAASAGLLYALRQLLRRSEGRLGGAWRHGLANLTRHPGRSLALIAAFGLGLMVLALLTVVRGDLLDGWRASLPEDAPNHFLVNIQPDEREGVATKLEGIGSGRASFYPMIRGRLTAINDRDVDTIELPTRRAERFVQRDANLTWSAQPGEDNRIVAGSWWTREEHGQPQVSLEVEIAEALGVGPGDELRFRIGGREKDLEITSLRSVRWDSFQPNFFLMSPPGVLEDFPATWMTSVHVAEGERGKLADLVRAYPSVTVIDVDSILEQVRSIIDRASLAVEYVFLFTLLAGLTVLFAAVQASRNERRFESALVRALGGRRWQIRAAVAAEFGTAGLVAGLLAGIGAITGGWLLAREIFELDYQLPLLLVPGLALTGAVLLAVAGLIAARGVIDRSPVLVLREGG